MTRVLYVTPECAPFAKAGGLGDVSAALPPALRELGVDVRVLVPSYTAEMEGEVCERFRVLGFDCMVRERDGFLFLDCPPLFRRGGTPYQDEAGADWPDNALRFGVLSKVAAHLASGYDVVHCHDWPAALAPVYADVPSVLTIHNLAFQGNFDPSWLARLELAPELFSIDGLEFHGRLSFLKGGLMRASLLTTVSETYAREIQSAALGCGLDGVLRLRAGVLTGILNGIDTGAWHPASDPHLAARYDADTLDAKCENKRALQARLGLEADDTVPLIGFVGRLTEQKGADLIAAAAGDLVALPAQLAVLGRGKRDIEEALSAAAGRLRGRMAAAIGFDEALAHLVEAGSDFFLMPSRFEPCGLNQMYSQRYGTPPVARATGGLADTVADGETGFLFGPAEAQALVEAAHRAAAAWREPARWREMQRAGMGRDFSWPAAARRYADLYARLARRAPR